MPKTCSLIHSQDLKRYFVENESKKGGLPVQCDNTIHVNLNFLDTWLFLEGVASGGTGGPRFKIFKWAPIQPETHKQTFMRANCWHRQYRGMLEGCLGRNGEKHNTVRHAGR